MGGSVTLTGELRASVGYALAMLTNRIAELRAMKGWSQQDLADRVGVSKMTISRYESGETLTLDRMQQLAEALECSAADLLNFAALADLRDEVEVVDLPGLGSVAAAMARKGLRPYRVMSEAVALAGIKDGDVVTVDESQEAVRDAPTGALVLAEIEIKGAKPAKVIRQFVRPGILVTNRNGNNLALSMSDGSMRTTILGVVMRD